MIKNIDSIKQISDEKDKMYQFIPTEFDYLTKSTKIPYKNINLKTDILINICNELIIKYLSTSDLTFNMWSVLLKRKYTKNYNFYFDYLLEKKFIYLVSNYYVGKKSKTYKVNKDYLINISRCVITDKVLLKKYNADYLNQSFLYFNISPIDIEIREKLVNDLRYVTLDYDNAISYLNSCKNDMEKTKYMKNLNSIDGIKTEHIFFKFDRYGRMHTNFTILKKEIRQKYIKIDGEETKEIDISNSQPFFFAKLLKKEIGIEHFNQETMRFYELVKNGLLYDEIESKIDFVNNRDDSKMLMYKVLFGSNNESNKENKEFRNLFPSIFEYIKEIKSLDKNYKEMSHTLQKLESRFIFDKVIRKIKSKYPHIKLFTVHDSITYPKKYHNEVSLIFNSYLKKEL